MSLGMNLTNSLWPLYVKSLGATVLQVSFVISLMNAAGTLLRVPSGYVSDRYGRRKIIITSILLAAFPPLLYALSVGWEQLIPWGIVYSIAFALFMPSRMAMVADYTPTARRTRVYSIMNLAWSSGSIVGPAVGGLLESFHGWNAVFFVAVFLYILCLMPGFLLPKLSRQDFEEGRESLAEEGRLDLAFFRPLLAFFLLDLFIGLGMGTVSSINPIYLTDRFNATTAETGLFISVGFGLTTILTQVPASMLADKFGKGRFITVCLALIPPLFLLWTVVDNILLLLLVNMAINGLWSMTWPAFISLLMEHTPRNRRGVSSGITQSGIMLGFTVGPAIGGYLWEEFGKAFTPQLSSLFFASR